MDFIDFRQKPDGFSVFVLQGDAPLPAEGAVRAWAAGVDATLGAALVRGTGEEQRPLWVARFMRSRGAQLARDAVNGRSGAPAPSPAAVAARHPFGAGARAWIGKKRSEQPLEAPLTAAVVADQLSTFAPLAWSSSIDACEVSRHCKRRAVAVAGAGAGAIEGASAAGLSQLGDGTGAAQLGEAAADAAAAVAVAELEAQFPDVLQPLFTRRAARGIGGIAAASTRPTFTLTNTKTDSGPKAFDGDMAAMIAAAAADALAAEEAAEALAAPISSSSSSSSSSSLSVSVSALRSAPAFSDSARWAGGDLDDGGECVSLQAGIWANIVSNPDLGVRSLGDIERLARLQPLPQAIVCARAIPRPVLPRRLALSVPDKKKGDGAMTLPCVFLRHSVIFHNPDGSDVHVAAAGGCSCRHRSVKHGAPNDRDDRLARPAAFVESAPHAAGSGSTLCHNSCDTPYMIMSDNLGDVEVRNAAIVASTHRRGVDVYGTTAVLNVPAPLRTTRAPHLPGGAAMVPLAASAAADDDGPLPLSQQFSQPTQAAAEGKVPATHVRQGTIKRLRARGALKARSWSSVDILGGLPVKFAVAEAFRMATLRLRLRVSTAPFRSRDKGRSGPDGECESLEGLKGAGNPIRPPIEDNFDEWKDAVAAIFKE